MLSFSSTSLKKEWLKPCVATAAVTAAVATTTTTTRTTTIGTVRTVRTVGTIGTVGTTIKTTLPINLISNFHSSPQRYFPLSDYNVFLQRQPRKWDFILFGNHPPMYPDQHVPYLDMNLLTGALINYKTKPIPWGGNHDTFNKSWQKYPWWNLKKTNKVPCTLLTCGKYGGKQIHFYLKREMVEKEIEPNLRNKCILYDLHLENRDKERLNVSQKNELLTNDQNTMYNQQEYFYVFLKHMSKRYLFEDVESLHFEEYLPNTPVNLVIPCRFYGLDQWWPSKHMDGMTQWRRPHHMDRPRYVQHEHEIEFRWIPSNNLQNKNNNTFNVKDMKIPSHLSITVEQFCLPWKKEITLADVNLPPYLIPMRPPHEIKILSLDFSHSKKLRAMYETDRINVPTPV